MLLLHSHLFKSSRKPLLVNCHLSSITKIFGTTKFSLRKGTISDLFENLSANTSIIESPCLDLGKGPTKSTQSIDHGSSVIRTTCVYIAAMFGSFRRSSECLYTFLVSNTDLYLLFFIPKLPSVRASWFSSNTLCLWDDGTQSFHVIVWFLHTCFSTNYTLQVSPERPTKCLLDLAIKRMSPYFSPVLYIKAILL